MSDIILDKHDNEYNVENYDQYVKDYEETALPDFADEAEGKFFEALEDYVEGDSGWFRIFLCKEKTKEKQAVAFGFEYSIADGERFISYREYCEE